MHAREMLMQTDGDPLVKRALAVIQYVKPAVRVLEKPMGGAQSKRPFMHGMPHTRVSYYQFGSKRDPWPYRKNTRTLYPSAGVAGENMQQRLPRIQQGATCQQSHIHQTSCQGASPARVDESCIFAGMCTAGHDDRPQHKQEPGADGGPEKRFDRKRYR